MGYITGMDGAVNGAGCVRIFEVDAKELGGKFSGAGTMDAVDEIAGSKDWSGRYGAYGHTPIVMPGEAFAFVGSIDGSVGLYGTSIVEACRVDIEIPQKEEEPRPISHLVVFNGNGALHKGAAVAANTDIPNPPNPGDLIFKYATPAGSPSWTTLTEVHKATLLFSRNNPTYRPGSSTFQTYRLKGNLRAQLELELYASSFSALPAEGSVIGVQLYVSATEFYQIDWMKVTALNAMTVQVEGATLVSAKPSLVWKPATLIGDTVTRGQIILPDETVWWPES